MAAGSSRMPLKKPMFALTDSCAMICCALAITDSTSRDRHTIFFGKGVRAPSTHIT